MTSHLELHMQAFNEARAADIAAGQATISDEMRAVIDALNVGEDLTLQLGRIERASSDVDIDLARASADAFLSAALAYNDLRSIADFKLLDRYIDKRANARRAEIQAQS